MNTFTKLFASTATIALLGFVASPASAATLTPRDTISGNLTTIQSPWGVTSDRNGNIYVANNGASNVLVFAEGADGNVAPSATIQRSGGVGGPLSEVYDVEVDLDGNIYVTDASGITVFAPGANGNATPIRQITGFGAYGVAVAADGKVYATLEADDESNFRGDVYVFAADASGDATPLKVLPGGGDSVDVAVDKDGNVYLSNYANASIDVWGADAASGSSPVRSIVGDDTNLGSIYGIDVLCDGSSLVVGSEGDENIIEHLTSSEGNVLPSNELYTGIQSEGLGIGLTGDLLVSDTEDSEILVFDYEPACAASRTGLAETGVDATPIGLGAAALIAAGGIALVARRRTA